MTFLFLLLLTLLPAKEEQATFKDGDIIFQSATSPYAEAIELATHSRFSHVGIIIYKESKPYVFEAVQPVKYTPLEAFIAHGKGGHYTVKRLKERTKYITKDVMSKIRTKAAAYNGKNYDLAFQWNDDRLYCSELVWKLYKEGTGLEVGKLKSFKDYDFSNPKVKQAVQERFGNTLPSQEPIISPEDIFQSDKLELVGEY